MTQKKFDARRGRVLSTLGAAGAMLMSTAADAQLTPERTYYGRNRKVPMTVNVPAGSTGEATIRLLRPVTAEVVSQAASAPGRVDLASLFPTIWSNQQPTLLYAQLFVGESPVGSAVVLQPLTSPVLFFPDPTDPRRPPQPQRMGSTYSGLRTYTEKHVVITTSAGEMTFRMRPDEAPNHCWNFLSLVEGGYYDDTIFHRIIGERGDRKAFVVQGGDPTGTGTGGPGYFVDLEPSRIKHDFGVLSMARSGDPNTGGSQFFVCLSREGTSFLDGSYTAFGEAVSGADAIRTLGASPTGPGDRPVDPPRIVNAKTVDAPPYGTGPKSLAEQAAAPQGR